MHAPVLLYADVAAATPGHPLRERIPHLPPDLAEYRIMTEPE
jgi:hypothetical protein